VTTPFVATIVLHLMAERRLSLDDLVARRLGRIVPYAKDISLRRTRRAFRLRVRDRARSASARRSPAIRRGKPGVARWHV
jgi:hypothetical protein